MENRQTSPETANGLWARKNGKAPTTPEPLVVNPTPNGWPAAQPPPNIAGRGGLRPRMHAKP
eukprot:3769947-Lingulodinium_polyedra.AAC.1